MDALISLYSVQSSPRFRWAAKLFFSRAMRVNVKFYSDEQEFLKSDGIKVNYSAKCIDQTFQICPHGLLWEHQIEEQTFYTTQWNGLPIFAQRSVGDLPFDPLTASFFLASRYEEYLPFIPDAHGRFPAQQSFAFLEGFLERPLINHWALAVGQLLFTPPFSLRSHYTHRATVDIDNLFAYKGKGTLRTLGGLANDLRAFNLGKFKERLSVLFKLKKDPYDTFSKQRVWNKKHGVQAFYFMLFAEFGPKDRNVSPHSTEAAQKLRQIADWAAVGIHPSYASNSEPEAVGKEVTALQEVLHRPIVHSRQHYLKLRMPHTFRNLLELGILHEHSMGYAELPGFRASICTPYPFYDLELEAETPLELHPFAFMDVTFLDYQKMGAQEALNQMKALVDEVRSVGGAFESLWHNRIFSQHEPQWVGWVKVYKEFISYARP